jgi:TPR repeat protein
MKRRWVIVGTTCVAIICVDMIVRACGIIVDGAKSAAVYRIRAEQGDAKSQFHLGALYYHGKGVPKDYVEAARWYRKSAEQGDTNAQYSLAYMYHGGKGLP